MKWVVGGVGGNFLCNVDQDKGKHQSTSSWCAIRASHVMLRVTPELGSGEDRCGQQWESNCLAHPVDPVRVNQDCDDWFSSLKLHNGTIHACWRHHSTVSVYTVMTLGHFLNTKNTPEGCLFNEFSDSHFQQLPSGCFSCYRIYEDFFFLFIFTESTQVSDFKEKIIYAMYKTLHTDHQHVWMCYDIFSQMYLKEIFKKKIYCTGSLKYCRKNI